jgi:hypothetical protein
LLRVQLIFGRLLSVLIEFQILRKLASIVLLRSSLIPVKVLDFLRDSFEILKKVVFGKG